MKTSIIIGALLCFAIGGAMVALGLNGGSVSQSSSTKINGKSVRDDSYKKKITNSTTMIIGIVLMALGFLVGVGGLMMGRKKKPSKP